uniref:Phage protein Gp138 N-terminal domain-containing protein n=1 Tax=viral metagenome TaxID=1070528 RepID=A0A6M3KTK7_9ZZZZ
MVDTLQDLLSEAIRREVCARVHVSLPGRVISYDQATQTAAVQPILRARFETPDGEAEAYRLPVLNRVPVLFPQGGGCSITWPLTSGDDVLLVISERSLAEWKANDSGDVSPRDPRRFDLSDAVAIAGLSSPSAPLAQVLADTVVMAAPHIALGSITAAQAFVLGTSFATLFNAHTHATPAGPSGPPLEGVIAAPMDNVASPTYPHLSVKIKGEV